jgi:hypothetical protein
VGELAVNTADGKLYTEHTGGVVKEIIPSTVVDGGITTAKIADGAVTSAKIADGTIATGDLADSAVTTAKIANANVTIAKISASGTPSSSTFLRGDGSWQSAGASTTYGDIGTYVIAFFSSSINAEVTPGSTVSGSSLTRVNKSEEYRGLPLNGDGAAFPTSSNPSMTSLGLSGTWRAMTRAKNGNSNDFKFFASSLFVRIS